MKNAANSITNAISIVLYCILHNTIQFKVVSIYGNIIAKPAGPAGQPSQGVPGVPFWPCAYYMLPGNAKC